MNMNRRDFIDKGAKSALAVSALGLIPDSLFASGKPGERLKVALVGTGSRGSSTWGKDLVTHYGDQLEMVGLCDINPKRVDFAKRYIGTDAPVYVARDFDLMVQETKP